MEKIAVGHAAKYVIDINAPVAVNLDRIARVREAHIDDLTVVILDRPRHQEIIRQIREVGARIRLITDGDVSAAIQATMEDYTGVDVLMGIGGAPEAVLAAAAIKCTGGEIQCKIWPRSDEEREKLKADGIDIDQVYRVDDLVKGNDVSFAATGITSGELADGVQYFGWGARTSSVMMRSRSGTVRYIHARHNPRDISVIRQGAQNGNGSSGSPCSRSELLMSYGSFSNFSMTASATCEVPTALGSSGRGLRS